VHVGTACALAYRPSGAPSLSRCQPVQSLSYCGTSSISHSLKRVDTTLGLVHPVAFKFVVLSLNENKMAANRNRDCSNPNLKPTIGAIPYFSHELRNAEVVLYVHGNNSRRHTVSPPFPRIITLSGLSSLDPSVHVCALAFLEKHPRSPNLPEMYESTLEYRLGKKAPDDYFTQACDQTTSTAGRPKCWNSKPISNTVASEIAYSSPQLLR
jgi:hypothetical protein